MLVATCSILTFLSSSFETNPWNIFKYCRFERIYKRSRNEYPIFSQPETERNKIKRGTKLSIETASMSLVETDCRGTSVDKRVFSRLLYADGIRGSIGASWSPVPRLFSTPINGDHLFFIFPRVMRYRVRAPPPHRGLVLRAETRRETTAGVALPLCHRVNRHPTGNLTPSHPILLPPPV